jgi:hypothetical protein
VGKESQEKPVETEDRKVENLLLNERAKAELPLLKECLIGLIEKMLKDKMADGTMEKELRVLLNNAHIKQKSNFELAYRINIVVPGDFNPVSYMEQRDGDVVPENTLIFGGRK